MLIAVGSMSARKLAAARKVARRSFGRTVKVQGCGAASGVPETPYDEQTLLGARRRALAARRRMPRADYALGVESGLAERYGRLYEEAWTAVLAKDGTEYSGYSSGLAIPGAVLRAMEASGMGHADVMADIEKELRLGRRLPNDTWATYSGGVLLRETGIEEAIRNALVQAAAPEQSLFKKRGTLPRKGPRRSRRPETP